MTESRTCGLCKFWDRFPVDSPMRMPMDNAADFGWCKRYAPRSFAIDEDADQDEKRWLAQWPLTYIDEWCGEWEMLGEGRI